MSSLLIQQEPCDNVVTEGKGISLHGERFVNLKFAGDTDWRKVRKICESAKMKKESDVDHR